MNRKVLVLLLAALVLVMMIALGGTAGALGKDCKPTEQGAKSSCAALKKPG